MASASSAAVVFSQHLVGLEVEHGDAAVSAREAKPCPSRQGECHAMGPIETRDLAQQGAALGIDHQHLGRVRDEQPVRGAVEGQVVPAAVPDQRNGLGDVVGLGVEREGNGAEAAGRRKRDCGRVWS